MHNELHPANHLPTLQRLLPDALNAPQLRVLSATILRHKPARRALIAYHIEHPDGQREILLGKWRAKGADTRSYHTQKAFYQQEFTLENLHVPEALALIPQAKLWLQRQENGHTAQHALNQRIPAPWQRIGQALAALHQAPIPSPRTWTIADELHMLHTRLHHAAALLPQLSARILALIPATERAAQPLQHRPHCGIHRDCYPEQILIDGERLIWLDLDLYAEGDPALDLGNFLAHLIEYALRQGKPHHHYHAAQTAFIQGYQNHSSHNIPPDIIQRWTLLSLARHIHISTQIPDRRHSSETLLATCETALAQLPS